MRKKQVFNPFLPLNEYIPDGEPHVFGDRVYLYGSMIMRGDIHSVWMTILCIRHR